MLQSKLDFLNNVVGCGGKIGKVSASRFEEMTASLLKSGHLVEADSHSFCLSPLGYRAIADAATDYQGHAKG